jgi:hypothetical protein
MTREEIAAMYLQVAEEVGNGKEWCWHGVDGPLPRFADLVAAAEREACAAICARHATVFDDGEELSDWKSGYGDGAGACFNVIRARGEK